MARAAPRAVVFRRGPSNRVLLLAWNTDTDRFEEGQWLKGRIYERRSDLSPDGELLLYFAATYRKPYVTWTAVSRPPYLTALALWPKGDGWAGGGQFETGRRIALNHFEDQMKLAEGFTVPATFEVGQLASQAGYGEDHPIWAERLQRDGWTLVSPGHEAREDRKGPIWIEYDPPIIWEKPHPLLHARCVLQMTIRGIHEKNGPWWVTEHRVLTDGEESHAVGRSSWADWSRSGELLFARKAALYRLGFAGDRLAPLGEARELIDLQGLTFTARQAPDEARRWPQ